MTVVQGSLVLTTVARILARPPDLVTQLRRVLWRTARPSELFSARVQMTRSSDLTENVNPKVCMSPAPSPPSSRVCACSDPHPVLCDGP